MKGIDTIRSVYFIGAGGIGMSALARYFLSLGKKVGGYDRVETQLTRKLNEEGAEIHYEDNVDLIPDNYKEKENTLVVLTPAVPSDHSELAYYRANGFEILKRAQVLGEITRYGKGICVAGTHGKTTTSSMIAHLLYQSHVGCNAFLGGILKNYDSNLLLSDKSDLMVIEADEYDRSFHQLHPYMAVITSATPDHLDIYGTAEAYQEAFVHFTSLIVNDGVLLMEQDVTIRPDLKGDVRFYTYAGAVSELRKKARPDFFADNVVIKDGTITFDFCTPEHRVENLHLGVPIEINITNAVAALAIGHLNGLTDEELRHGIKTFQGPKRRFDFHIKREGLVLIDDYAHHPEELNAAIESVKKLYPGKKLTVIFQPHLYSRTKDFYQEFAESLSKADTVILIPIYPAREEPIPGVTSQLILDYVQHEDKHLYSKEEMLEKVSPDNAEVVLIAGAGDIELLVEPLKNKLNA